MRADSATVAGAALHQPVGRLVVVVLQPVLVPCDLAVKLVDQIVDRGEMR